MIALLALLLAAPLTLRCDDTDVAKVLAEVFARTKAAVRLDEEFHGKKISLDADEWQLVEVLEEIAKRVGGEVYRGPDGAYRILPAWKRTFLKRLHETKVKLRLDDATPLRSVVQTFRELTGVPVVLDPGREEWPEMELRSEDVTGAQFLDLALTPNELRWDLRYGVVFVSSRARLADLPARLDLAGVPDRRISSRFREAKWRDVAKMLARMTGLEVVGELPKEGTLTLEVPAVEYRHLLELILVPHGFDAKTRDGKLIVKKRVAPTPCPNGFPELKKEAEALDRAKKLTSKEELAALSTEAIERLDDVVNEDFGNAAGAWCLYYLGEWYALRGERIDKREREVALQYLKQVEESVQDPRLLEAARAARQRLEAAPK